MVRLIPPIGLGTWKLEGKTAYKCIRSAIDLGIRHFDCAHIYENEKIIGKALNDAIAEKVVTRQELWVTSKLWNNAHLNDDVVPALQRTLNHLGFEYLDLYLMHWPVAFKPTVHIPKVGSDFLDLKDASISATWEGLEKSVHLKLTKRIGVSNFSISKLEALLRSADIIPFANQVESHPYLQQQKLKEFCDRKQIIFAAYSPLGSGDRPTEMRSVGEPVLLNDETIEAIAERHNCSPAQILISWAMHRNTVVIFKTSQKDRIKQAMDASTIKLSVNELNAISALDCNFRYVTGSFWEMENGPYNRKMIWA